MNMQLGNKYFVSPIQRLNPKNGAQIRFASH